MKVKLGSFDEEYAKELADALKSIGVGVEVKRSIVVSYHPSYFVEGKFSELRNKYEETELMDEIMRWKKFIDIARSVDNLDELEEKVYNELFGNKKEIKDKEIIDFYYTLGILYDILDINNAIEGDKIGKIPEDPVIRFPYDVDDEDVAEKLDLSKKLLSLARVEYDVYVDICDAISEKERIVELCKEYEELIGVFILICAIYNIIEKIGDKKVDIKELLNIEKMTFEDTIELRLSSDVIKAILDSLEKEGIIKIKKGKVFLTT